VGVGNGMHCVKRKWSDAKVIYILQNFWSCGQHVAGKINYGIALDLR
jgi:hypothetical protein